MNAYEKQRAERIKSNRELLISLNLAPEPEPDAPKRTASTTKPKLKPKEKAQPQRTSARLATTEKINYAERPQKQKRKSSPNSGTTTEENDEEEGEGDEVLKPSRASARLSNTARPKYRGLARLSTDSSEDVMRERKRKRGRGRDSIDKVDDGGEEVVGDASPGSSRSLPPSLALAYKNNWSWIATAPPPTRSESTAQFHFESHPEFTPNKSPKEILRQGSFGGSFFRPLTPRSLGGKVTISDDWMELPTSWTVGLDVERYLTSSVYDPSVNRYGVACGQSIEEWEAAGWINAEFDVRGWFQWYCRFFMGRRCEDDERQVGRWARCVGPRGRWRKALFKKYVEKGVRVITDEEGDGEDVSPVIHQTCLHWAFEPRQEDLDELWG